jgi:hypothetical protein
MKEGERGGYVRFFAESEMHVAIPLGLLKGRDDLRDLNVAGK